MPSNEISSSTTTLSPAPPLLLSSSNNVFQLSLFIDELLCALRRVVGRGPQGGRDFLQAPCQGFEMSKRAGALSRPRSASHRRRTPLSPVILKRPISPAWPTCVPPPELHADARDLHHTHDVGVFLSKEGHRSVRNRIRVRAFSDRDSVIGPDPPRSRWPRLSHVPPRTSARCGRSRT